MFITQKAKKWKVAASLVACAVASLVVCSDPSSVAFAAKRITGSTPRQDGFRMPGEFEEQKQIWMVWPERPDNWRNGGK
nr:hypothetical protein [Selenomonadaceae bacterium]